MKKNIENKSIYKKPALNKLGAVAKTTKNPKGASKFEPNGHASHIQ